MAEQNLMNMSPAELVEALMNDNSLVSEFDRLCLWDKFVPFDWSKILSVPKFIEKAKEYDQVVVCSYNATMYPAQTKLINDMAMKLGVTCIKTIVCDSALYIFHIARL